MRLRTTLALFIVTAGLTWFVARDEFARSPEQGTGPQRLFVFKQQQADRIEITGKDQKITLQRRAGEWWITKPVEDRADPLLAEAIVQTLLRMQSIESFKREDFGSERIKRAGLNGSAVDLVISGGGKILAICKVGAHTAIENSIYLELQDGKKQNMIHAARLPFADLSRSQDDAAKKFDLVTMLQTAPEQWRDPALLRIKADDVRRLTFSAGTGLMELHRGEKQPWELARPLQTRASDERVNAVLNSLLRLAAKPAGKASAVTTATPATAALPGMKVSIEASGRSKPVELTLQAGSDPEAEIRAVVSDRPGTFLLPGKAALIWKLQPNDLRDQRLARLDANALTAIRIRSATNPEVVLDRQGEVWMLSRFGKSAPANHDRIHQMIGELNAAQVREFTADAANNLEPYGLHQPILEVEWREGEKESVLKFGINAESHIYCQYAHEPFIYRINPSVAAALPADAVKWQGLGILNLSTLTIRRIIIADGAAPSVTLNHDPLVGTWNGEIAGQDITAQIVKEKASALLNKLASLSAETWVTDRTAGYEALKNPAFTVQLLVIDPAKPDAPPAPRTLTFASTNAGQTSAAFYGKLDNNPDLFLINREQYLEIVAPVVK